MAFAGLQSKVQTVETKTLPQETQALGRAGWSKRVFAWMLARGNQKHERAVAARKCSLLGDLAGTVVEIGPGAGVNLAYYPSGIRWIGMEPNPFLHPYLRKEAAKHSLEVELRQGVAELLEAEDDSVDAVVSTLVLSQRAETNPAGVAATSPGVPRIRRLRRRHPGTLSRSGADCESAYRWSGHESALK